MEKTVKTTFLIAVVMALLCTAVYALPDNPPTCSLSTSSYDTTTTAVLTSVSVDTLTNAGVDTIKIYENGGLINTYSCGYTTSCVSTKVVTHTSAGTFSYYAVCKDRSGQQTSSSTFSVHFAGLNRAPIVDSLTPSSSPVTINEDQTLDMSVSAHDPDGDALSYEWKVDGSTVSTSGNSYTFSASVSSQHSYTVAVYVRDGRGGVAVRTWTVIINDLTPSISITSDSGSTECDTFTFDADVSSYDGISSIVWDFGDGQSSSGTSASASHYYGSQGTYTVTVTVTDGDGDTASDSITVTASDISPQVDAGADQTVMEGQNIQFSGSASMPCDADAIASYAWDFGDGSTGSGQSASHTYTAEGTYTVTFTVCDEDSCTSDTLTVTVTDAEPTADFDYSPASPNEGESIQFTDTSTSYDPITAWSWDFNGDGIEDSNAQNPTWTFTSDGNYDVTLTVTDTDGDTDSHTETIQVNTVAPSGVTVILNTTSGTEPVDVHADCTAQGGNLPYTFQIDFGDGTAPVAGDSADHTYVQNGAYTVTCTVTDVDGDTASGTATVDVADTAPTADFTWTPQIPNNMEDVSFDATASGYDIPLSYAWDFGDGATSTLEDPIHAYANGGDYTITLTVTDNDGTPVTVQHDIHVSENPPIVEVTVTPASGMEPLTVDVDCAVLSGGRQPFAYVINFSDGTIFAGQHASHVYPQNGTYSVTCSVTDADNDVGTDTEMIVVDDSEPTVSFTFSPQDPVEGDDISFNATITAYDTPVTILWDFDDGTTSTIEDPTHTYLTEGVYTVTVTVTDADGSVATDNDDIFVDPNVADNTTLFANTTSGYEPLTVQFACTATSSQLLTYVINFGDGNSANAQTAVHTYAQQGTFDAVCTVTDEDGDVTTDTVTITVLDTVPVIDFTFDPANPVEGEIIDFTSTIDVYDIPYLVQWDFDDGSTSTEENPEHSFFLEGEYNVTLTVTDNDGSTATVWHVVTVGNNPAVVNIVTNTTGGPEPLRVSYNCTAGSLPQAVNGPFTYLVDFGDGTTTTDNIGTHEYPIPGDYVMECTGTDVDGDSDSDEVIITVSNDMPIVDLTAVPTSGLEGITVDFTCAVSGGNAPLTYVLNFGDGSTATTPTASHTYPLEGVYDASCTVTDADGDIGSDNVLINISNNAPVVDLDVNATSGLEPLSINYTCNVGGGNDPLTYLVDFGDGSTSIASTGTHDYPLPGTYTITCTVTDTDGDSDEDFMDITVINNPPVVDLIAIPTEGLEGITVDFNCSVSGGNLPFTYLLDFGDGNTATTPTASHAYMFDGVYNATCTVTDADLDVGADSQLINITNNMPVANLVVNVTGGLEPLSINYTCNVGGGNAPFTYVIDFGDSTGSTQPTGTHDYPSPGSYLMKCEVLDADGDMDMDFETILVINNPPEVDLIANPTSGLEGVTVDFNCSVNNGNTPFTYLLDFGDGTTSTSPIVSHTYGLEGLYNATCTVTDADLDVGVDSQLITVANNPPVVNLVVNATSGLEPLSINYTCNVGGGNSPFAYVIDFGDGSSTVQPQGAHDYPNPGIYTISCIVNDVDGDTDSDSEFITVINNGPVVDLQADPTTGPEGIEVDFNCSATNGNLPLTYLLDFGDGTTSSNPLASHTYRLEGLYNATCSVMDVDGDTGIDSQLINITNNPPVVNLVTNVTSGLEPLSLSYVCNVGNGNAPFGYSIDFGDGTTSTAPAGTHDYPAPGTYLITCTVTDVDGDMDNDERVITVINNPPVVNLIANPTSGLEGMTVDFNCSITAGNSPFNILLDFGDGTSTTNPLASHTYSLEGAYNATCTVTDADGDVGIDSELISVANNPPVVNLITNVSSGVEPLSVLFNCTVGNGNAPFDYMINFGDGWSAASSTATHTYAQNGTYIASCLVQDADGDTNIDNDAIIVFDSEPNANFTWTPTSPLEGDVVQFTDASTAYDGIVAWYWNFGDMNTSTAQNPTHTYTQDGIYLVLLTVTDSDGSSTSNVQVITVQNNVPDVAFTVLPSTGTEPLNVLVRCLGIGGNAPLTYLIMYGDGTSTTLQNSTHIFTQDGTYPVTCQITDADGDVGTDLTVVTVNDTAPTAAFTFSPANPRAGDTVTFTDTSTAYDGITAWAWDFENDGIVDSVAQNPTHVYASANLYVANLTVTDADGSTAWTIRTVPVNISVGAPIIFGVSAVDITNVSANITWGTDQGTDSLVEYGLTISLGSTTYAAGTIFNHNMPLSGLVQNTTYYYNVTSCNMFAVCSEAGPFNFTTLPTSVPDITPPGPVLGLNESGAGSNWITWSWTNPSDVDFNHVEIWVNGTFVANTTGNSYNVTGLSANTTYEVTIVTVDTTGNRNTPGVTDTATTTPGADITPPGPVTSLNETGVGTTWINWAWTNPSDLDYNHAEVWVNGSLLGTVPSAQSSYNATGLTQNTTYQIVLVTVDNTGNRNTPGVADSATTSSTVVSLPIAGISAVPASGIIPLQVQFNASVTGGVAPYTFAWTFGDGTTSTLQNPLHIYNVAGPYTVTLNVTDSNGNWDTETTTINANVVVHDIAVNSINYTNEGRTIYLYDAVQVNASVTNEGTVSETFTLQLEIDGIVVATQAVTIASGISTTASLNWANASTQGFHTALVRAVVVGDTDLTDQSSQKNLRVWSVNDIVDTSTRYIVYWAGVAYVPILNAYINETYYDLKATMSSGTAIVSPPATQLVTLNPSETKILMWTVAALPGDVLTVTEGNNELTFATTV
jgi:PKD repeat protein